MDPVNILDARNNLSKLVSAASAGEQVIIAKRGVPVARLVAASDEISSARTAGRAAAWLSTNPVPGSVRRTPEELDDQIDREREGWE